MLCYGWSSSADTEGLIVYACVTAILCVDASSRDLGRSSCANIRVTAAAKSANIIGVLAFSLEQAFSCSHSPGLF